jgi:hypothetical protein
MTDLTPSEITRAFFEAIIRDDWEGAVGLADPSGLAEWRARELAFLAAEAEFLAHWPEPSAGGSLVSVPTDEAVVAERLGMYTDTVLPGLTTRTTLGELVALPAAKLFELYLQLTRGLRGGSASGSRPHITGETIENETTAFVLYRWHGAGWPKEPQVSSILRLRRGEDGWRCVVDPNVGSPCFAHALLLAANEQS